MNQIVAFVLRIAAVEAERVYFSAPSGTHLETIALDGWYDLKRTADELDQ